METKRYFSSQLLQQTQGHTVYSGPHCCA